MQQNRHPVYSPMGMTCSPPAVLPDDEIRKLTEQKNDLLAVIGRIEARIVVLEGGNR